MKHIHIIRTGDEPCPTIMVENRNGLKINIIHDEDDCLLDEDTVTIDSGVLKVKVLDCHKAIISKGGKYPSINNPYYSVLELERTNIELTYDEVLAKVPKLLNYWIDRCEQKLKLMPNDEYSLKRLPVLMSIKENSQ